MIIDKTVNITYGGLEQALLELGFQASRGTNSYGLPYVVYENLECDAVISLPERPKDELMYGGHYIVAERTVEGRGVADIQTFHRLLGKASHAQVA